MVDPGKVRGRIIRVATWQGEQDRMDTTIHEALHALLPFADEECVTKTATDLARLLWRLGYRRTDQP